MENQDIPQGSTGQAYGQSANNNFQISLPNSTTVLVLGILSIVLCCCYGVPGIVLGIIALVLAPKANEVYLQNPNQYTLVSFNNLKAGRICAIVGLSISAVYAIFMIIYLLIYGLALSEYPYNNVHYFD